MIPFFLILSLTFHVQAAHYSDNAKPDLEELAGAKAAPWWDALRDESYYRTCQSSCTDYSKGTRTSVELCDDTDVCRGKKETIDEFATRQCTGWKDTNVLHPSIKLTNNGKRFKHEPSKGSWISCAIFCQTDSGYWYSPRRELGRNSFFPDGTWCHREHKTGKDYFCQKNLCLPEGYEMTEAVRLAQEDLQNSFDGFLIEDEESNLIDTLI